MSNKRSFAMSTRENEQVAQEPGGVALCRWLVSFATASGWYPVGEYLALNAAAAIERAVEVFGPGAGYQAEKIPWDAAPLFTARPRAARPCGAQQTNLAP
jgi:hypothetical protein